MVVPGVVVTNKPAPDHQRPSSKSLKILSLILKNVPRSVNMYSKSSIISVIITSPVDSLAALMRVRGYEALVWAYREIILRWRHNGRDSVSNHQPHDCLLNRLFRRRSKKTSKLRVTRLCAGNSPVTGEFPAQRGAVTRKMFPFDDVIMNLRISVRNWQLKMLTHPLLSVNQVSIG